MRAGQLRDRVTIQRATSTPDTDTGQPARSWSAWKSSVPAKVEQVSGGEVVRGRAVHAEATILVTIRYLAGVTTRDRISWDGRTAGIVWCGDPYGERRQLRIECREDA